jgi:putative nucleotidyltransferase with HDIG domain
MSGKSHRVLIAFADTSDLLLLRRILRETPYIAETARSATAALRALCGHQYSAIITDDERLPGMPGAKLLAEASHVQPGALRVLLARADRMATLEPGVRAGAYVALPRPFFSPGLRAALLEHAEKLSRPPPIPGSEPKQRPSQIIRSPRMPLLAQDDEPDAEPPKPLETRVFPALIEAETLPHDVRVSAPAMRKRMLLTMVEMVEAKGGPSPGHGLRVSALSVALGREAGIKGADLDQLEEAALLHDVGELAVVAPLLQKNRRLTPAEQRQIQRHVESGAKIAHRGGLTRLVQTAIRHHHERWDGKGYPDRLVGTAIPLAARIIAVADTWDALATRRPYRPKIGMSECLKTLGLLGGAQLDAELVGLFLRRKLSELCDWAEPESLGPSLLEPPWSSAG